MLFYSPSNRHIIPKFGIGSSNCEGKEKRTLAISVTPINLPTAAGQFIVLAKQCLVSARKIFSPSMNLTHFLNKLKNVRSFELSSCSWLSAAALVGVGCWLLGVPGLVFGVEVPGVANGVFEVEVIIQPVSKLSPGKLLVAAQKSSTLRPEGEAVSR